MPSGNLLGLGKKSEKGFEQEEVTDNSFSSLLLEEDSSFLLERVLWKLPLLMLKRFSLPRKGPLEVPLLKLKKKETLLPLHSPSQQSYEVTSGLLEQGGEGNGEEVHGRWSAELRGLELINYFNLKGLSMGKARATMGWAVGKRGAKTSKRSPFSEMRISQEGGSCCNLCLSRSWAAMEWSQES